MMNRLGYASILGGSIPNILMKGGSSLSSPLLLGKSSKMEGFVSPGISPFSIRFSSTRTAGLVGLPSAGKSTLFNVLIGRRAAIAANYPFTTIEPNIAPCLVPDPRLEMLAKLENSQRIVNQTLEVHDIAGLIAGAASGDGLGNQFLANIRTVQVILHVVRCFSDPDILHVMETPDPVRDIQIIEYELILSDLQQIEKMLNQAKKMTKTLEGQVRLSHLEKVQPLLESGLPARHLYPTLPPEERKYWWHLQLLTQKPMLYVCNADDDGVENDMTRAVREHVKRMNSSVVGQFLKDSNDKKISENIERLFGLESDVCVISARLEEEAADLDPLERQDFLNMYGKSQSGVDTIIKATADLLQLRTFYTVGPQEARSWVLKPGATAPEAAGEIHSDLRDGFIKADIVSAEDVIRCGGYDAAKAANCIKTEGKEYVMRDGDVAIFKHNNTTGGKK